MNGNASEWLSAVDGLPAVHARLRCVVLENLPAVRLIRAHDGPEALFYCDAPYPHATRASTGEYRHEMTEDDHRELLDVLRACRSKVMVSGYPCQLYDETLHDWTRHTFDVPNQASGAKIKDRETEVLWCNF